MRKALKIFVAILAIGLVVAGVYLYRAMPRIPDRPFVKPSGPYAVGTMDFDWVDSSRGEPYTRRTDDKRHVPVQIWYPAMKGGGDTARYLIDPRQFSNRMGAFVARNARINSVLNAPVAGDSAWPVLLYNHGGGWTRWSATFVTEWLASQGYIVVSVEHFGFNQSNKYSDGVQFSADTLAFPASTGNGVRDARQSWAYLGDPVFGIWKADAQFALDRLEAVNREPGPFRGRLDLTRVGAFGWSFGGALAVQLSKEDPRVIAAVDHDGQLFDDVRQAGTTRPVMLIHHGVDDALEYPEKDRAMVRELMAETASWDSTARVASTSDWYELTIAGIDHGNFSDLVLFMKKPEGRTDPRRAHEIINAYTLQFFDQYLRGKPSDLLAATTPPFSEAKLEAWRK
ncbi:MAG TPA: dienelactone hydrolase family protein [Gemmatimonadales bacterium]|nr:dienelactone hydrolase family protein [Gemmatimonadales bacterium]